MIILEKFDPNKVTTEKVSFHLGGNSFNLGQGGFGIYPSPLCCLNRFHPKYSPEAVEFQRQEIWAEIKVNLPLELSGKFQSKGSKNPYSHLKYFGPLVRLAKMNNGEFIYLYDEFDTSKPIKLLYDYQPHGEMIKRCIEWLSSQLNPPF